MPWPRPPNEHDPPPDAALRPAQGEGNQRFTVWRDRDGPTWHAAVWPRNASRPDQVLGHSQCLSKSQAIDWLARYRVPETKETVE